MPNFFRLAAMTAASLTSVLLHHATAADIGKGNLPAVSAINGKVEFGGGAADLDDEGKTGVFYGSASLAMPMGESFGAQADVSVVDAFGHTDVGGAAHLFTRDPESYLVGVIGGYGDVGNSKVSWGGGEAEFYMDQVSLEAAAGFMRVNPSVGSSKDELFVHATVAFYAMDNLRLSLGGSSVAKFETANLGAEYLLDVLPASLKLEGRIGENGYASATAGIAFYFGGDAPDKTLIRRHREDDPCNYALDVFGAGAAAVGGNSGPTASGCPTGYGYDLHMNECFKLKEVKFHEKGMPL